MRGNNFRIDFMNNEILQNANVKIEIYTLEGKLVKDIAYDEENADLSFSKSILPRGILIVKASTENSQFNQKIFIE